MTLTHWTVLESLCLHRDDERYRAALASLSERCEEIDWAALFSAAISHKMLAPLAAALSSIDIGREAPVYLYKHAQQFLFLTKQKTVIFRQVALEVSRRLRRRGIAHAFIKGIVSHNDIFRDEGDREMGDLDVAVSFADRQAVIDTMYDLGFQSALPYLDGGRLALRPYDRKLEILYQLAPDHLPHFSRATNRDAAPAVVVDFSHDILWHANPFGLSLDSCFDRGIRDIRVDEGFMPAFTIEVQFLWTVLHLFRDAWLMTTPHFEKDVSLSKFRDVLHYWVAYESLRGPEFRDLVERGRVEGPVSWVLWHADSVFGTRMLAELGLPRSASKLFLNSASLDAGRTIVNWSGSMAERLRSNNRRALFDFAGKAPWHYELWDQGNQ